MDLNKVIERTKETETVKYGEWAGATRIADPKLGIARSASSIVDDVLIAIRAGAAKTFIDCSDKAVIEEVRQLLKPEELARVEFV